MLSLKYIFFRFYFHFNQLFPGELCLKIGVRTGLFFLFISLSCADVFGAGLPSVDFSRMLSFVADGVASVSERAGSIGSHDSRAGDLLFLSRLYARKGRRTIPFYSGIELGGCRSGVLSSGSCGLLSRIFLGPPGFEGFIPFVHAELPLDPHIEKVRSMLSDLPVMEEKFVLDRLKKAGVRFNPKVVFVRFNLGKRKWRRSYLWHFVDSTIKVEVKFWKEHRALLKRVEDEFDIPSHVIVSLLTMETALGRRLPSIPLVPSLFSVALCGREPLRGAVERLGGRNIERRSELALEELYFALVLSDDDRFVFNLKRMKGSFAGAVGIPQFLPSSVYVYGTDGSGDGRVDLLSIEDAVFSTANYLVERGDVRGEGDCIFYSARPNDLVLMDRDLLKHYPSRGDEWEVRYHDALARHWQRSCPVLFDALLDYNAHPWYAAAILENARLLALRAN